MATAGAAAATGWRKALWLTYAAQIWYAGAISGLLAADMWGGAERSTLDWAWPVLLFAPVLMAGMWICAAKCRGDDGSDDLWGRGARRLAE